MPEGEVHIMVLGAWRRERRGAEYITVGDYDTAQHHLSAARDCYSLLAGSESTTHKDDADLFAKSTAQRGLQRTTDTLTLMNRYLTKPDTPYNEKEAHLEAAAACRAQAGGQGGADGVAEAISAEHAPTAPGPIKADIAAELRRYALSILEPQFDGFRTA